MSSPSSSGSVAAKRKRQSGNSTGLKPSSTTDMLQPSSRDASDEDAGDALPRERLETKHKKAPSSESTVNPPSKRVRRNSGAVDSLSTAATSVPDGVRTQPTIHSQDPGEPSDTTEGSTDIAARSKRRAVRGSNIKSGDVEIGKALVAHHSKAMPPPRKAEPTAPVGYSLNPPPQDRPVRVYADGVFDLFHLGHMRQLEQAKKAFPNTYLLVGVTGDAETHRRKGLTVLSGAERSETVRHCKWVDEVVDNCPWVVNPDFIEKHQIDYVAHDDLPYGADEGDDIYKPVKEQGKFLVTQRTEGVSTTGIITKIVRDYESYISRQLKRGTSRQELNVSWLKKNELDLKRHVMDLRESIKHNWSTTGQELGRDIRQIWNTSRSGSPVRSQSRSSLRDPEKSPTLDAPTAMHPPSGTRSPALQHLGHLDIPPRPESPGGSDFAAGYSLGLIGGVRSWMTRTRGMRTPSRSGTLGTDQDESNVPSSAGSPSRSRSGSSSSPPEPEEKEKRGRTRSARN